MYIFLNLLTTRATTKGKYYKPSNKGSLTAGVSYRGHMFNNLASSVLRQRLQVILLRRFVFPLVNLKKRENHALKLGLCFNLTTRY